MSQLPFGSKNDFNWDLLSGNTEAIGESQLPFGSKNDFNGPRRGGPAGRRVRGGSQLPFGSKNDFNPLQVIGIVKAGARVSIAFRLKERFQRSVVSSCTTRSNSWVSIAFRLKERFQLKWDLRNTWPAWPGLNCLSAQRTISTSFRSS